LFAAKPCFQQSALLHWVRSVANNETVWVDSAIFIHKFVSDINLFMYLEFVFGPILSVIRYLREGSIPKEFGKNPSFIISNSPYLKSDVIPWFTEMFKIIQFVGGFTEPLIGPEELRIDYNIVPNGNKLFCGRKVILPGHFSTPIAGKSPSHFLFIIVFHCNL
jgi:hypothetical protein